jgi:hypothetical protein
MYVEAYAHGGRWGYYWWPGVDVETRMAATVPVELVTYGRFSREHRDLFEESRSANELAILYADGPISRRPPSHLRYLALAQALEEGGFQFDVMYGGDGRFNEDALDPGALSRYRTVALPEARGLGAAQRAALEAHARAGGDVVAFTESPLDPALVRRADGTALDAFWCDHRDEDGHRIMTDVDAPSTSRIESSDPGVRVIRYENGDRQVLHLMNHRYDEPTDTVATVVDLRLRIPWRHADARCTMMVPGEESRLDTRIAEGVLSVDVPVLRAYAVLVLEASPNA